MSTEGVAGRPGRMRLCGHVTLQDVIALVGPILRAVRDRPGTRVVVGCAAVTQFTGLALVAPERLRRDLRGGGTDLALGGCSAGVRAGLRESEFLA